MSNTDEHKLKKLMVTVVQMKQALHALTLRYNRLKHENKALTNELNALKQRSGNG